MDMPTAYAEGIWFLTGFALRSLTGECTQPAQMVDASSHQQRSKHMQVNMKAFIPIAAVYAFATGYVFYVQCVSAEPTEGSESTDPTVIDLPTPRQEGPMSLEEAIFNRKATRTFAPGSLTVAEVSQLLWAGGGKTVDGVTGATRAYPSAGGLYPIELYLVAEDVDGVPPGIYHYRWKDHTIEQTRQGRFMDSIKDATYSGTFKRTTVPACIVATAVYSRTTAKYGERGEERYVPMDMGGCGENIFLQATALGLGTVVIGAFDGAPLRDALGVPEARTPLYVMPIGRQ